MRDRNQSTQRGLARGISRCAPWPYAPSDEPRLPACMPDGSPWPLISIVTPTRSQARYIEETLLSVRHQNYPRIEHIVMDGGSTDGTMEIVERYKDGLAHAVSERDRGQSDAINKGMRRATGDILTWLNSDDMLAPGALAAAAIAFRTSGADLVAGECHVQRDGRTISRHLTACADGPLPLDDLLDLDRCWNAGQFFYQPEVLFTRSIWERAGAHVREDLFYSMDYELWCRLAHAGARLKVIGRPIALFRAHADQKTASTEDGGFNAELPKARDAFLARIGRSLPPARPAPLRKRLRITLINDLGYAYGAGVAHRRLAQALMLGGHEVRTLCAARPDEWWAMCPLTRRSIIAAIEATSPDLVVLGNLHGAGLEPALVDAISQRFPVAIVLHDLWWLTGRCAYTGGCRQYISGCDSRCSCPQAYPRLDPQHVRGAWEQKRDALGRKRVSLWANSQWSLERAAEALAGLKQTPPAGVIAFGLEPGTFVPRDRAMCRELLGLPRDQFVIMTSATSTDDERKGLGHLARALELAKLPDVLVIAAGHDRGAPPIPGMRMMGYVSDQKRLATMLSASDLFVGPSLEESFGQVFIEAAACGTPCVGYAVGGKPEAALHSLTGLLSPEVDPRSLARAITRLYSDPELRSAMGRFASIWAQNEWSMSRSYARLAATLRETGVWSSLGLPNRLDLSLEQPNEPPEQIIAPTWPAWRAINGFDGWEGPYPDKGLGRFRWMHGPRASFELSSDTPGPGRVLIAARCNLGGQRIRVSQDGRVIGERAVPAEPGQGRDVVLSFDATFTRECSRFEVETWKWHAGARPMALLVTSIVAVADRGPSADRQIEAKPALSGATTG